MENGIKGEKRMLNYILTFLDTLTQTPITFSKTMKQISISLLFLLLLQACSTPEDEYTPRDLSFLLKAQDTALVLGDTLLVKSEFWIDLMPGSAYQGSFLYGIVDFMRFDSLPPRIPYLVDLTFILRDSTMMWETFPHTYTPLNYGHRFHYSGDTPWKSGDTLTIFFTFLSGDSLYVVRNRNVPIEAVY
jgi:hypothetical protein